jgi:secondary thiamine-phosphate synthase enzyme
MILTIPTTKKREVIDLTAFIAEQVRGQSGHLCVLVQHTTAAITTADLDPGTDQDLLDALESMMPHLQWRHPHNPAHAPDHLLASIIGPSIVVPVRDGSLQLGTWQRIVLLEFNGPQQRAIDISFIGEQAGQQFEL